MFVPGLVEKRGGSLSLNLQVGERTEHKLSRISLLVFALCRLLPYGTTGGSPVPRPLANYIISLDRAGTLTTCRCGTTHW
jgi:hypothetical protein